MVETDISEDALYGGRLRIRQAGHGYRVNVDTVLLAASLPAAGVADGARIAEIGCGIGAALLIVAANHREMRPNTRFWGIERDPAAADLARVNAAANHLSDRVEIVTADAFAPPEDIGVFDRVFFNPPYDNPGEGRLPIEAKRAACVAERPIGDWIKVWSNRMASHSNLTLIHRPERLREILAAFEGRLGGVEIFPIRPSAGAPARRIIVRAWKGSRAPLKLLDGLNLHPQDAKAKHTPEAEAILRGEEALWL